MQLQFFFLHSIPTFEKMAYSGIESEKPQKMLSALLKIFIYPFFSIYSPPFLGRRDGGGVCWQWHLNNNGVLWDVEVHNPNLGLFDVFVCIFLAVTFKSHIKNDSFADHHSKQ